VQQQRLGLYNTISREPIEQISMSLFPNAPATSTPNSSPCQLDGRTLLVTKPTPTRSPSST
jgi:hypothetical protein